MSAPFIADTDSRWFDLLSARSDGGRVDEVNFWQPRALQPMTRMAASEPASFRPKQPRYATGGYGFFAHFRVVTVEDAWDLFG
jgi:hypothetical protein